MPREANYAISVNGAAGAHPLATARCHKMEWLWAALGPQGEVEALAHLDMTSCKEPSDIASLLADLPTARVKQRVAALREMAPKAPAHQ